MARDEGLDNNTPRAHLHKLSGLPLRLRSAHYGLAENFPAFALAAALALSIGAGDRVVVNLLGLARIVEDVRVLPELSWRMCPHRGR